MNMGKVIKALHMLIVFSFGFALAQTPLICNKDLSDDQRVQIVKQEAESQGVPAGQAMAYHLFRVATRNHCINTGEDDGAQGHAEVFALNWKGFGGTWDEFKSGFSPTGKDALDRTLALVKQRYPDLDTEDKPTEGSADDGTLSDDASASGEVDAGADDTSASGEAEDVAEVKEEEATLALKTVLANLIPDPERWFNRAMNIISGNNPDGSPKEGAINLFTVMRSLGWVLMFTLFVYSLVHSTAFFRSGDYLPIFMRLAIATTILLGAANINDVVAATWKQAYANTNAAYMDDINGRMWQAAGTMAAEAPVVFGAIFGARFIQDQVLRQIKVPTKLIILKGAFESTIELIKLVTIAYIIIMLMYGIYGIAVFTSGFMILILMISLPILAALAMRPEYTSWLLRSMSIYLTALMIVVVGPVTFSIVMDLAFGVPMGQLQAKFTEASESFQEDQRRSKEWHDGLREFTRNAGAAQPTFPSCEYISGLCYGGDGTTTDAEAYGQYAEDFKAYRGSREEYEQIAGKEPPFVSGNTWGAIGGVVAQYALMAVLTVVGLVIGFILMMNLERILAAILGGLAGSGGQALLGLATLAALGGRASKAAQSVSGGASGEIEGEDDDDFAAGQGGGEAPPAMLAEAGGIRSNNPPQLPGSTQAEGA